MIIPICDGNDDEVFECESKHEQLLASPSSSESSSASKPRPGPLLLRVSCPGPWEWLRVEQQPLNYADSSHNRGWEKVCERQSRRFFDALASRKPPSDSKPVFLFFPSFSLSLCTYSSFPAARSSTTRAFLKRWRRTGWPRFRGWKRIGIVAEGSSIPFSFLWEKESIVLVIYSL